MVRCVGVNPGRGGSVPLTRSGYAVAQPAGDQVAATRATLIDAVTVQDVKAVAARLLGSKPSILLLGPKAKAP